jgi:prolyl 4-hydroxylase
MQRTTPSTGIPDELRTWIVQQARAGVAPEALLAPLLRAGWAEADAVAAVEREIRGFLEAHAREHDLPLPLRVPAPPGIDDAGEIVADGHAVQVLAQMLLPRVIVFGNLLSAEECVRLIDLARGRLQRSRVVGAGPGGETVFEGRTSEGMSFARGANPLCERIERRVAALLDWPSENGEGLQVLRYSPGARYEPHYDWFDPAAPGSAVALARGGQRVASLVMYLNTPQRGGATVFTDARFEVAARQGNAVFFSYERPHAMTRTLHAGAPVVAGEKWIATLWLRERRFE